MAVRRRQAVVVGAAALLLLAGCGGTIAGAPVPAPAPGSATTESSVDTEEGFDECGLVEPEEIAEVLGVPALYVTGRTAMVQTDGSRTAGCVYFPEDVPGMIGMQLNTVADTGPERFFAPFARDFENVRTIPDLGDRAEAVAYRAQGTPNHYIEIRTLLGSTGLHLFYTYRDDGGVMPVADGAAAAVLLTTALTRLPDEVTIPDGTPSGGCADIDLGAAGETVGADLDMARSVASGGGVSCYFSGGGANIEVNLIADRRWAEQATVAPDAITHADLGDGAHVSVTDTGLLNARVNLGDRVVAITATYADPATTLRPADVELVRTTVASADEWS